MVVFHCFRLVKGNGVQRATTFGVGVRGCAIPDEKISRRAIKAKPRIFWGLKKRLGLGFSDDVVEAVGAFVGIAVFAGAVFDDFRFDEILAVFTADAGQFAVGAVAVGNANAAAVGLDEDKARKREQGLTPAGPVKFTGQKFGGLYRA